MILEPKPTFCFDAHTHLHDPASVTSFSAVQNLTATTR